MSGTSVPDYHFYSELLPSYSIVTSYMSTWNFYILLFYLYSSIYFSFNSVLDSFCITYCFQNRIVFLRCCPSLLQCYETQCVVY